MKTKKLDRSKGELDCLGKGNGMLPMLVNLSPFFFFFIHSKKTFEGGRPDRSIPNNEISSGGLNLFSVVKVIIPFFSFVV